MIPRRPRRCVAIVALLLGAWLLADATYLEAKAWLAQALLERAWVRSEQGRTKTKPWPWADTNPVARLRLDRLHVARIVLAGDSARNLAFGPAWNEASSRPGESGISVISGHRDTHFGFLRKVQVGDEILIELRGTQAAYRVSGARIVDATTTRIAASGHDDLLMLVTCYPFDSLIPGGALRYVIEARRSQPLAQR